MKTDRLIDVLSANLEPACRAQFGKTLLLATGIGGVASFGLMLATVGPRPDLQSTEHLEWLAVKLIFALAVIGMGLPFLLRTIRPGQDDQTNWAPLLFPFIGAVTIAAARMLIGPPEVCAAMLVGVSAISPVRCLICITLFSAIPLAALIWAINKGAPVRLKPCGAIAGIVAGGVGAAAYACSCSSDTFPFIAIWYGAAIALCAAIGAQVGSRFLRW